MDPYYWGYAFGFSIRRGTDVETESWFNFVALI